MKLNNFILMVILISVFTISSSFGKQKIGVYDSRLIAIMYANSEEFEAETKEMMEKYQQAVINKDSVTANKLKEDRELLQRLFHDKGFGKGSVAEYLEDKTAVFKALADKLELTAIVSKWELNYYSDDVELIDITIDLLKAMNAKEKVLKMYDSMKANPPMKNAFFLNMID